LIDVYIALYGCFICIYMVCWTMVGIQGVAQIVVAFYVVAQIVVAF